MNNSKKQLGIYIGGRANLSSKKDFYQANVEMMSEEDLPYTQLDLLSWIKKRKR